MAARMVKFDSPACLALIFAFAACSTTDDPAEYAETVYTNGKIYKLKPALVAVDGELVGAAR